MGNLLSKQRRLPKINVKPDEFTSTSDSCLPNSVAQMGATQHRTLQPDHKITSISDSNLPISKTTHSRPPEIKIKFRVLIIGRANAGKTSILQRVCDTTDSPVIYRVTGDQRERVQLDPSVDRGKHSIEDELVFSNHDGYVFHDSRGFEAGSKNELEIVQAFIRERSGKRRLQTRLHAIWYCVPMDNQRPELDLKYFQDICPDQNVPVIAVFTKYDQFRRNIGMHVEDFGNPDDNVSDVVENRFKTHYLRRLGEGARFVRLEKMNKPERRCNALLEKTVESLNDDVVALMLLAVQRRDLKLSVKVAVQRVDRIGLDAKNTRDAIRTCLFTFPQIWFGDIKRKEDEDRWESEFKNFEDKLKTKKKKNFDDEKKFDDDDEFNFLFLENEHFFKKWLKEKKKFWVDIVSHVMSLPIVAKHTPAGNSIYHLRLAIILILRHAAALCLSGLSAKSALTQAESDYQKSNIASKIEEHFTASYQEYSVQQFIDFLIDTSIAV